MNKRFFYIVIYFFTLSILMATIIISLSLKKEKKLREDFFSDICFFDTTSCLICNSINNVFFKNDTTNPNAFLKADYRTDVLYRLKCEGIIKSLHLFPVTLYHIKKNKSIMSVRSLVLINNSVLELDIIYNSEKKRIINMDDFKPFVLFLIDKIA